MHLFNPFSGISDHLQLMYGRTAYFKYFELAMYEPIHFVWVMAVHRYIDCTNLNLYHKFPTYLFDQFGGHLHPVQLMYGNTANFNWSIHMYFGIPGKYGCTPVQKLYESGIRSQMLDAPFQCFWW